MSSKRRFDPKTFLSHVTTRPGIYQMRDADGVVLYVGKAKNLRKRLASYFRTQGLSAKTQALMQAVVDIDTTATASETEALILENNLIKTHRPKFNILLRDDKSYPFIHLSAHPFARLSLHRGARKQGEYFGPYPNVQAVRHALELLQKVFRVRQCEDSYFANRSRPCLQYQIGRCYAPCVGYIDQENYTQTVVATRDFLKGRSDTLLQALTEQMHAASEAQEYERAARLRDQLIELRKVTERQHMVAGVADVDVLAVVSDYGEVCVQALFYRDGHNVTSQAFYPKLPEPLPEAEVLGAFISQFYHERNPPPQLVLSHEPPDADWLIQFLTEKAGRKVQFITQPREERRHWLEMAQENAKMSLSLRLSGKLTMENRFRALAEAFQLPHIPQRLECGDISHLQGENTIASCVVFDRRGALKSDYRRYKIAGITAGDDYAAMRQMLMRRFTRLKNGEGIKPDIFFVDGGRGQLNQALEVFAELGITDVQLIGVAKGQGRKAGLEQFWFPHETQARYLAPDSQAMQLIVQIRDEAHRFAITGHRSGRDKKAKHSMLENIAGVGAKRRQALIRHFGGIQGVLAASCEELARVEGISVTLAQEIYATLHNSPPMHDTKA